MYISTEDKKTEAVKRMKALEIDDQIIESFKNKNQLYKSVLPYGMNYAVSKDELNRISRFEQENDALVYYMVCGFTDETDIEFYLYVSDNEEDWYDEVSDIESGIVLAYAYYTDFPDESEAGCIETELTIAGGLRQVI